MPEYLTPEGRLKIENQLSEFEQRRPKIAKRLRAAKELGDLSENTAFTAAKDEQGWIESETVRLKNLLRSAEIIQNSKNSDKVRIGSTVRIKTNDGERAYTIVGSEEADPANGRISHKSQVGQALLDKKKNEKVTVQTPKGSVSFKITSIE